MEMPKFEANKDDFAGIWQRLGAIAPSPSSCAASWGTLFFLSLGIFGLGPFWWWGLEVWLCFSGLRGGTRARGV